MNRSSLQMKGTVWLLLTGAALSLGTSFASAHHSFAAVYDLQQAITVKGTIVQVRLTNPHSWFYLDVKNEAGETERWAFEAGTPSGMIRNGYKASVIKQGAEVTITGFHARDASQHMGMLRELVLADGTKFGLFGPQEGPNAR
jgi:DNA/RNA endonuclease YhcR with UshA esterase domain